MDDLLTAVDSAEKFLRSRISVEPKIALVLGSGLSSVADAFEGTKFAYSEIPGMPQTSVSGHRGELKLGSKALFFLGRFHHYEGFSLRETAFPVFLAQRLGVSTLILTNACGAINSDYRPSDLVLVHDHINLMGSNPFVGPHEPRFGPRFFDMTNAYDIELRRSLQAVAVRLWANKLHEGVYAALCGPSYETPAEIRFLKTIGADLVGMSTVPEVIAARSVGMKTAAVSCVTNLAAGLSGNPLNHAEVLEIGRQAEQRLIALLQGFLGTSPL